MENLGAPPRRLQPAGWTPSPVNDGKVPVPAASERVPDPACRHGSHLADPAGVNEDVRLAQRAVIVHQAEDWPAQKLCRNCHQRAPCPLHRWGLKVLLAAGWTDVDIAELVARANAGDVPWARS